VIAVAVSRSEIMGLKLSDISSRPRGNSGQMLKKMAIGRSQTSVLGAGRIRFGEAVVQNNGRVTAKRGMVHRAPG